MKKMISALICGLFLLVSAAEATEKGGASTGGREESLTDGGASTGG